MTKARKFSDRYDWLIMGTLLVFAFYLWSSDRPNVNNVSAQEASALISGGAVVIDVRGKEAFDARHIPGALNFPLEVLRQGIPAVLASSKASSIVVYCGDGDRIGPQGTALLNDAGYTKAVNVKNGIQGWADAGLKVAN